MADQWGWENWEERGAPNRYGYYGLNCKNKPSGTGTTHSNRKAQRAHLQWSNLPTAEPDTEESLLEQAAALDKAAKKAKAKVEELKKKREEEEEDEEDTQEASSSSTVNYRGIKEAQQKVQGQVLQPGCFGKGI